MEKEEEKYWECGGVGDGSGGDGRGKVNKSSVKGKELILEEQKGEKGKYKKDSCLKELVHLRYH